MSVIIRLQNLPWSANALDIRQFFKGLSIPEGGVHIVGGEMGDAFIAFSTDEDARQAMMKDRGKLNEVQVRLLLSSRAEMQKVIEKARQQSILALQKAGAIPATTSVASLKTPLSAPQPPVITTNSLQNILGTQLGAAPSFQTYQQQAGITLIPTPTVQTDSSETKVNISSRRESNESSTRDRRRSTSRDRRRSRSRDRSDRSSGRRRRERSRSRERDRKSGRQRSSRRSRSREHSRDRTRNGSRSNRNSRDCDTNSNNRFNRENTQRSSAKSTDVKDSAGSGVKAPAITSWNMPPTNAYETATVKNASNVPAQRNIPLNAFATAQESGIRPNISNAYTTSPSINDIGSQTPSNKIGSFTAAALPNFQNFSTSTSTTNNYSINFLSNPAATSNTDANKPAFALQNPYTAALRAASSNSNSQDSNSSSAFSPNMQQTSSSYSSLLLDKKTIAPQQPTIPPILAGASPLNTFAQQSPLQQTSQQQQPKVQQQQPTVQHQQPIVEQQQPTVQQPIAFANTNPYAQMYPNLFAQAAAAGTGIANPVRNNIQNSKPTDQKFPQRTGGSKDYKGSQRNNNDDENDNGKPCSIKISNMCSGTTYSDLRKFFSGLFIPHNGIKMINDRDGLRTGVAYIQFSRSSCIGKAMIRNNTLLKTKRVILEPVTDEEFRESEDSYKPHRDRDNYNRFNRNDIYDSGNRGVYDNRFDNRNSPSQGRDDTNVVEGNAMKQQLTGSGGQEPITVLHVEDIPAMATEVDIMKMFSVFTIFDILLTVSPGNRREFTAYVKFSREEEAKAALMEQSRHMIGHRKVRVRPAKVEEMEKAKEKLRLANEQLKKEEAALSEAAERDARDNDATEDFNNIDDDGDDLTILGNEPDMMDENDGGDNNRNERSENPNNDVQTPQEYKTFKNGPSDPRLRRQRPSRFAESDSNDPTPPKGADNNDNSSFSQKMPNQPYNGPNFNPSFNAPSFPPMNNMENNFIILKNCDYNTRINDVAQLMLSANLDLKHIEPLRNERQMPSGEFIVEFTNTKDAASALNRFNNTPFRNRNLRVRDITPQEIADRIGKPFMNYFPGGGRGGQMPMRGNFDLSGRGPPPNFRMNGGYMDGIDRPRFDNMNINMNNRNRSGSGTDDSGNQNFSPMMRCGVGGSGRGERSNFNNQDYMDDDDDNDNRDIVDCDNDNMDKSDNEDEIVSVSSNGPAPGDDTSSIPEKFSRPGCVLALENVPFKADLKDIIEFFGDFDVMPDDIIRRFNDDGSSTGDARVAFPTPAKARAAFEAKRQHTIFNRTIYINTL